MYVIKLLYVSNKSLTLFIAYIFTLNCACPPGPRIGNKMSFTLMICVLLMLFIFCTVFYLILQPACNLFIIYIHVYIFYITVCLICFQWHCMISTSKTTIWIISSNFCPKCKYISITYKSFCNQDQGRFHQVDYHKAYWAR